MNEIKKSVSDIISPTPSSSSSRESGSGDGFSFVTDNREPSGDPSLVTNTSGKVTEVNVTGIMDLTVVAGGKGASKSNGFSNSTNLEKAKSVLETTKKAKEGFELGGNFFDKITTIQTTKTNDSTITRTYTAGYLSKEEKKANKK